MLSMTAADEPEDMASVSLELLAVLTAVSEVDAMLSVWSVFKWRETQVPALHHCKQVEIHYLAEVNRDGQQDR